MGYTYTLEPQSPLVLQVNQKWVEYESRTAYIFATLSAKCKRMQPLAIVKLLVFEKQQNRVQDLVYKEV